jgi:hypothetical protein
MPNNLTNVAEAEPETGTGVSDTPGSLQQVLDIATDPKAELDRRFRAVHELHTFGLIDKAREVLSSLPPSKRRDAGFARIEQIETGERLLKHVIPDIKTDVHVDLGRKLSGIMVLPSRDPTPFALIYFGGNGERNFTLPHPLMNRLGIHLIFLKDSVRCFSLCEIARLGPGFDANLARLKLILGELEATSVFCLGTSAGAFPALKFGLELDALGVLAFSGTPSLNIEDDAGATLAKYPQLRALSTKAPHLATSMVTEYASRPAYPSVTMVYGGNNKRDAFFASLMEGMPGVKLAPIEGFAGHGAFKESLSKGIFPELLDRLFGGKQITKVAS